MDIVEIKTSSDNSVVFHLADLVSLCKQRLEQLGMKAPDVNSTRLKEKLLAEIPELESHKNERNILLAFKKILVQPCHKHSSTQKLLSLSKLPRTCEDT